MLGRTGRTSRSLTQQNTLHRAQAVLGQQVEIDYLTGSLGTVSEWSREPDCPTCGHANPELAHIFAIAPIETDTAPQRNNT